MRLLQGRDLSADQKRQVLSAFIYRWTSDNRARTTVYKCGKCDISSPYVNTESSMGHTHPTIPLQTDEQWLQEHGFVFTRAGQLSARHGAQPASVVKTLDQALITSAVPRRSSRPKTRLDSQDTAAILAGLRLLQLQIDKGDPWPDGIFDIFSNYEGMEPYDSDGIDTLCELINCSEVTVQ